MADYTETFTKTTGNTIAAADFETEFDAIATAVATKANKIASATNGNLVTMDANGDITDAGITAAETVTLADSQTLTNKTLTAAVLGGTTNVSGGQLAFPATQSASADVNTLDDYEEGTFTPYIADTSLSDAESQTYSQQHGYYTKIGDRVFFDIYLVITSLGSLTTGDQAFVDGLPFTALSDSAHFFATANIHAAALSITAGESLVGTIDPGTSYVSIYTWSAATGVTLCPLTDITASGQLKISGNYKVA